MDRFRTSTSATDSDCEGISLWPIVHYPGKNIVSDIKRHILENGKNTSLNKSILEMARNFHHFLSQVTVVWLTYTIKNIIVYG